MTHHLHRDESGIHLRRGFRAAAVAVGLTLALLLAQDWLPDTRAPRTAAAAVESAAKAALPPATGPASRAARP